MTNQALTTGGPTNATGLAAISASWEEKLDLIKSMYPNAKNADLELFYHTAKRMRLDPLAKQIHLVTRVRNKKIGDNWIKDYQSTIQVGIDGYRLIADRTGVCAGNDDPLFDEGLTQFQMIQAGRKQPTTATVTVYKVVGGVRCPFTATATWDAYCPKAKEPKPGEAPGEGAADFMWKKMPFLMLAKCAEALALRKAFPGELSGVYTDEEMHQAGQAVTVEVHEVARPALQAPAQAPAARQDPPKKAAEQPQKPPVAAQAPQTPPQASEAAQKPAEPANENALDDLRLALQECGANKDEAERLHNKFAATYKGQKATVAGAWDAYQAYLKSQR